MQAHDNYIHHEDLSGLRSRHPQNDRSSYPVNHIAHRFGVRLRDLRKAHNLTQSRMAAEFGIDRSFISDLERGQKAVCLPLLDVLARGLNLSLSDLLDDL